MIQKNIKLFWHQYKYFPYEKELAFKELGEVLNPDSISDYESYISVSGDFEIKEIQKLAYFSHTEIDCEIIRTIQRRLEDSVYHNSDKIFKKQSTRYSVHGMHEYKGKFNPQIVRGLFNIFGVNTNSKIIDPFCGSGTTLVEAAHIGAESLGFDINPLAVYITNAKLKALNVPAKILQTISIEILREFEERINNFEVSSNNQDERFIYLKKWFPENTLNQIELLKNIIEKKTPEYKEIFFVLISNLLRDYSLQEPADLRIRRRYSPFPEVPLIDSIKNSFSTFLLNLEATQKITETSSVSEAIICDIRDNFAQKISKVNQQFDFALTSPPYATALPYIDTQRLSLVWLNLCEPAEIKKLEHYLIGSREFDKKVENEWIDNMANNYSSLPSSIHAYCMKLQSSLSKDDGFRRQAVPWLLYRYFSEMQCCFNNMKSLLKSNSYFLLVVGKNQTTLGGEKFLIDTPTMLKEIAEKNNWIPIELFPLQTYHRYNMHSTNSIREETLIVLKNK
jgi:site-specific DNA-methyltransferase (cytosine-N4-specific)